MRALGLPGVASGKQPTANAGDTRDLGLISGLGRPPGGGHGNPFQYSCLENPTDRGAWRAAGRGVAESQTRLSDTVCTHTGESFFDEIFKGF